jgi:hypothetical protein
MARTQPVETAAAIKQVREQIAERVDARLEELTNAICDAFRKEISAYAGLDDEVFGEVRTTTRLGLALTVKAIAEDAVIEAAGAPLLQELARRRAAQGVPVQALMTAYVLGARIGWQFVLEEAARVDVDAPTAAAALSEVSLSILGHLEQLAKVVSGAFD